MEHNGEDIERLRSKMTDYYGTGAFSGMLAMLMEVSDIDDMSDTELIEKATREGFLPTGAVSD